MTEVAFVLAPRQNLFFAELVAAVSRELEAGGVSSSVHRGVFPPPREDLVYALVPPHEFFALMHDRLPVPDDVLARTIAISAEQPDSPFFEANVELARRAGAVLDINRLAVRRYRQAGVAAEHLQLGWTRAWDRGWKDEGAPARDVDVLFMGAATERRLEYLSAYAPQLWDRRCRFVISDNSRPNWAASGSYVADEAKWDLLLRTKVLVNLHQGETPYFEWLRLVQAMANGCAVVTEHSVDFDPLEPNHHFLAGRPESLGWLAELLLTDDARRDALRRGAYAVLRDHLPMDRGIAPLAVAARQLAERAPVPSAESAFFRQPPPSRQDADRALARLAPAAAPDGISRRALKDMKLDLIDLRRRLDTLALVQAQGTAPKVRVERRSPGWSGARPRISVLVTLFNYERHIEQALDSLLRSRERSWEVVVVDDGSSDRSLARAAGWIARHPSAPALLARHPVNRGLAAARNTALAFARGELCFVLDADNEIYPNCFERLLEALERDPAAAFAYGLLERFSSEGPAGLMNIYPWEPERFQEGNYIDAMALVRTRSLRALGGYRTDRRLYGWEDYDLFARMAEEGLHGAHVASYVARYRASQHSMLSVTNISDTDARSVIAEACPKTFSA